MTYGYLQADCLYTGISSGHNAGYRVWEAFTFFTILIQVCLLYVQRLRPASHARFRHRHPCGLNSSIDENVCCICQYFCVAGILRRGVDI